MVKPRTKTWMAEAYFPVRVRVAVPRGGFGHQLNTMHAWLGQQIGEDRHWTAGGPRSDDTDSLLFYFLTVDDAKAFIGRFACGLSIQGKWERLTNN